MANRSKSRQSSINRTDNRFKRGVIIAILGFIPVAALWVYLNRDKSFNDIVITLGVAAVGAAFGLWLVYRFYYKK